ncbi:MAG TPA: DoxX family protein [Gemmatimonadota bacterium]|nr:DoxX family protein [Gemmatimonadota bacterium]
MTTLHTTDSTILALGLLAVRLILGLGLASHGAQKLFGWFGGYGLEGTGGFFESLGFRPGRMFAGLAGLGELGGGLLTALGFLGPVGPGLMILVMLVAMLAVHRPNGFFASEEGIELPLLYAAGALGLAVTGPGPVSLDAAFGLEGLSTPTASWIAIAAAVVLALGNVALRRPAGDAGEAATS